jgi:hypothetical protein
LSAFGCLHLHLLRGKKGGSRLSQQGKVSPA